MENIDDFHSGLDYALMKLHQRDIQIKEHQYEAIKSVVVNKRDTICVLPTGYGKSRLIIPDASLRF